MSRMAGSCTTVSDEAQDSPVLPVDSGLPGFGRGSFLLSLDTELAWGGIHNGEWRNRLEMFRGTREAIGRLLELLETYRVRATWAFVGHLLLEECSAESGVKHPEVVRPVYSGRGKDWFEDDPCSTADHEPFWYAPDIVESVLDCEPPQEIGCHTFSHVIVGRDGCGRECIASEVDASKEAAERWGIELRSFVFPRDEEGHHEVLAEAGFRAFRSLRLPRGLKKLPRAIARARKALQWTLPLSPLTARPTRRAGMWDLPATTVYYPRSGLGGLAPVSLRMERAVRGLDEAADRGTLFHLYFHPFNLATDPDGLLNGLEAIFRRACELRDEGTLENPTMGDLAHRLDAALVAETS